MDLYLVSTELRTSYEPIRCRIQRRLRNSVRDDLALVSLDQPIGREVYDTEVDLDEVILAVRLEGMSLFPMSECPVYVYICRIENEVSQGVISDKLTVLDWGAVHCSRDQAKLG
jgi:hypothetical protein